MPDQEDRTMEFLILPLLIGLIAVPSPGPSAARLADFTRLDGVEHEEVYVVDTSGLERRLTLVEAGDAAVKFMVGQQQLEIHRDAILRVDRVRDSSLDGAIKGMLFGLLVGAAIESNVSDGNGRYLLQGALTYGGIGYLFDRGHTGRQAVYRRP
jgi:hypothetical protein